MLKVCFIKNKKLNEVYCVRGKVKYFDDIYKCCKYIKRNKLDEKGFEECYTEEYRNYIKEKNKENDKEILRLLKNN